MATAGFHRLIDPPRSRSSTKPQSGRSAGGHTPADGGGSSPILVYAIRHNRSEAREGALHRFSPEKYRCNAANTRVGDSHEISPSSEPSTRGGKWIPEGEQRICYFFSIFVFRKNWISSSGTLSLLPRKFTTYYRCRDRILWSNLPGNFMIEKYRLTFRAVID